MAEAQASLAEAEALSRNSQDVGIQMEVRTSSARVEAASGKPKAAIVSLNEIIARAAKLGCVSCEFQSRLALGEIEIKSEQTATGRYHLAVLEHDATAKGFFLIAHKAATDSMKPRYTP